MNFRCSECNICTNNNNNLINTRGKKACIIQPSLLSFFAVVFSSAVNTQEIIKIKRTNLASQGIRNFFLFRSSGSLAPYSSPETNSDEQRQNKQHTCVVWHVLLRCRRVAGIDNRTAAGNQQANRGRAVQASERRNRIECTTNTQHIERIENSDERTAEHDTKRPARCDCVDRVADRSRTESTPFDNEASSMRHAVRTCRCSICSNCLPTKWSVLKAIGKVLDAALVRRCLDHCCRFKLCFHRLRVL